MFIHKTRKSIALTRTVASVKHCGTTTKPAEHTHRVACVCVSLQMRPIRSQCVTCPMCFVRSAIHATWLYYNCRLCMCTFSSVVGCCFHSTSYRITFCGILVFYYDIRFARNITRCTHTPRTLHMPVDCIRRARRVRKKQPTQDKTSGIDSRVRHCILHKMEFVYFKAWKVSTHT